MIGKPILSIKTKKHEADPNRVSHKIDFKAVWPRNGHADSMRVEIFFES